MGKSDEVRRLLDERGVEHRDNDVNMDVRYTRWDNGGKREVRYEDWSNGTTRLDAGNVSPEQAIAATVGNVGYGIEFADWCEFPPETMVGETVFDGEGNAIGWIVAATADAGTCKDVCASVSEFTCSECGFNCDLTSWISLFDGDDGKHRHHHHGTPKFCPNCGRKVVTE